MSTKNLLVRGGADFSGWKKSLQKAQNDLKNFKENVSNSVKGIVATIATLGAGLYIKDATKDAASFEAKMTTLSESLGKSILDFEKWQATVGRSLGYSKLQSAELANTLSLNFKQFATSQQDLLSKTTKMMEVAALVANKRGMAMSEVSDRIRSAMNQEADGADELGVNVRVSAIQQSKAYKEMANGAPWEQLSTNMQKAILYHHILEQVSTNLGTTIQDTTSKRISVFTAALGDLKLALGQAFLPILYTVLPVLTAFINKITSVISIVAQFTQALFGKRPAEQQAAVVNKQASAVSGLGDSYKKAGKEAKKASGFLAGFDEINQVGKKGEGASGSGDDPTGGAAGGLGMEAGALPFNFETNAAEISAKVQAMADRIKQFFRDVKSLTVENKNVIIAALGGITAALLAYTIMTKRATIATGLLTAATTLLANVKKAILAVWAALTAPITLVALAIGAVVAAFIYFYRTNEKFRGFVDGILLKIKDVAIDLWKNVLIPFGGFLKDMFVIAWEAVGKAAKWLWQNILVPFGSFLKDFWNNILVPVGKVLGEVLVAAFKQTSDIAKSFHQNVLVPLGDFFKSVFAAAIENIAFLFNDLWKNIFVPLGQFLKGNFSDDWKFLTATIKFLWENVLKPLGAFVGGLFKDIFDTTFTFIGEQIGAFKTFLIGLMTFLTGAFTGDWRRVWQGLRDILDSVFRSLKSIVKTPLNYIIDMVNAVIGGLNKIKFDMPDWAPGVGGKSFGINISKIPKLAKGGITNGPTLAMIGDNPGGQEVVSPLDDLIGMISNAVKEGISSSGNSSNSGNGDIIIQVGEAEFARIAIRSINKAQRTAGKLLLDI